VLNRVTPTEAGWSHLSAEYRRFAEGEIWEHTTAECEACIVILGGRCSVRSNHGNWEGIGERATVFDGLPYGLFLPRNTSFTLTADTDKLETAFCWVPTTEDHPARLITPGDSRVEIRGGRNATRQINSILPPGSDCHRIVCVEVYTPGGNWSSYPPHKHDEHRVDASGSLVEADLEEIYFYKIDGANGYALERVYTPDRSIDAAVVAHSNDIVLIPEGFHPVSAAYGYDCYYLNFLAGSAQSLANVDDPDYAWTKNTWDVKDPRVPLVTREGRRHA
jgi:5-deoxy-glucuronate isomerase